MKQAQKEKYLGDIINDKGNIKDTIENRIAKAWSYVSEIGAILSEFPFGNKKIQVGLMLREAMFLNGVLHSSESWHGITSTQNWTRTPGIVKGNKSLNLVWFE